MLSTEKTTQNNPFEKFPLDFNAYLGARLGVDRNAAMAAVGRWLEHYEPVASHPGLVAGRRSRSGIFPTPSAPEPRATAETDAA